MLNLSRQQMAWESVVLYKLMDYNSENGGGGVANGSHSPTTFARSHFPHPISFQHIQEWNIQ